MLCEDSDYLEAVQVFLHDVLDQVVRGVIEHETDEGRNIVQQILQNLIIEITQRLEVKHSYDLADKEKSLNAESAYKNADLTQTDHGQAAAASVTLEEAIVNFETKQTLKSDMQGADEAEWAGVTDKKQRCLSSMLEFALYDSPDKKNKPYEDVRDDNTSDFDTTHIRNLSSLRTGTSFSDTASFADRLESFATKYASLHPQSIKSLQTEYIQSIVVEKTDAKIRDLEEELKAKVFPKFSKLKKRKTRYGKVKIYYNEELSKNEENRIVKNAEALLKQVNEEKEKKRRRQVENEKTGFRARIRKFFRGLSCCNLGYED